MASASEKADRLAEVGVPLLAVMVVGYLMAATRAFPPKVALAPLNKFVFYLSIPALMGRLLAIQDLASYEERGFWRFTLAFGLLRVVGGVLAAACAAVQESAWGIRTGLGLQSSSAPPPDGKAADRLGSFVRTYMASTWMNTVVFGLPLVSAVYGPQFGIYTVLAALSSVAMQLPVMLATLEVRAERTAHARHVVNHDLHDMEGALGLHAAAGHEAGAGRSADPAPAEAAPADEKPPPARRPLAQRVVVRVLRTPPVIGIVAGFLWSACFTTGSYEPPNPPETTAPVLYDMPDYVENGLLYVGNALTGLAAFCVGLFAQARAHDLLHSWRPTAVYTVVKLGLYPLLAIPVAALCNVEGDAREVFVLLAAMPIAVSSFTVSHNYRLGESVMAGSLIVQTVLMLPALLVWSQVL